MPSSYLLSTTKVCTLDAAADHKHKPVEQPLDPQWCRDIKCHAMPGPQLFSNKLKITEETHAAAAFPTLMWGKALRTCGASNFKKKVTTVVHDDLDVASSKGPVQTSMDHNQVPCPCHYHVRASQNRAERPIPIKSTSHVYHTMLPKVTEHACVLS
eukprot:683192-Pelagomonas_calceolata.AAC.2